MGTERDHLWTPHFLQRAAFSGLNPSWILLPYPIHTKKDVLERNAQSPSSALFFPPPCAFLMSVPDLTSLPSSLSSSVPKPVWSNPDSGQPLVMTPGTPGLRFAVEGPDKEPESRFMLRGAQGGLDHLHWYPCHSLHPSRDALLAPQIFPEEAAGCIWGCKGQSCISGMSCWRERGFADERCSALLTSADISVACTKSPVSFLLLSATNVNLGGSGRRARLRKMWETNYKFLYKSKCVFLNTPPLKMRLRFSFHNKPELWTF